MSWWTDIRDKTVKGITGGIIDPKKDRKIEQDRRDAERDQRKMVNAQIKAYQDQTALFKKQIDDARAATDAEKRRVNEKQIRSIRRTYRAQGASILGIGNTASDDMSSKLGI